MHTAERQDLIFKLLKGRGFASFREIEETVSASAATLRRDLDRMAQAGLLTRVHGGAKLIEAEASEPSDRALQGVPFHANVYRNATQKSAIGRAAAQLCQPREAIMIDGGSTTLAMCQHLEGLELQVLTNSLHIVDALLAQAKTQVLVPGGMIFREQNIILSVSNEENLPRFHAPRLFMGAASIGVQGIIQADHLLAVAERHLIDRATELIVLVDSSKFNGPSGHVVCGLDQIDVVVTDTEIDERSRAMLTEADVKLIIA